MADAEGPRLYLQTPDLTAPEDFAPRLAEALAAVPVACVRLALPASAGEDDWTRAANHLIPVCHAADVALVVTDHFRLVAPLGLDGVHLATARTPLREVRKALGSDRIVGTFAGTSRHAGMTLAEAGADYVSFGPVAATGALGDETLAGDDLFEWWAEMIETPVVAEGGIGPAEARRLAPHADFLTPDPRLWQQDDPLATLRDIATHLA